MINPASKIPRRNLNRRITVINCYSDDDRSLVEIRRIGRV